MLRRKEKKTLSSTSKLQECVDACFRNTTTFVAQQSLMIIKKKG